MKAMHAASLILSLSMAAYGQHGGGYELGTLNGSEASTRWNSASLSGLRELTQGLAPSENVRGHVSGEEGDSVTAEVEVRQQPAGQAGRSFKEDYWYLHAGLGPSFTVNSDLKINGTQPGAGVKFYPGARADVAAGYQFTPWFGLEGELGFTANRIKSIEGSADTSADFAQISHIVSAIFKLPNDSAFEPYVGAGLGLMIDVLDVDTANVQGIQLHGRDAAAALAMQLTAGLRWKISDRWAVDLAYEYLATSRPEFDVGEYNGAASGDLTVRNPRSHSLLAMMVFKF